MLCYSILFNSIAFLSCNAPFFFFLSLFLLMDLDFGFFPEYVGLEENAFVEYVQIPPYSLVNLDLNNSPPFS